MICLFLLYSLRVSFIRIVFPVVPEGAASHRVHDHQKHQEHYVDHCHPLPIALYVVQQPRLARVAPVAQLIRIVAPSPAVRVPWCRGRARCPIRRADVLEVAVVRRLAASRLKIKIKSSIPNQYKFFYESVLTFFLLKAFIFLIGTQNNWMKKKKVETFQPSPIINDEFKQ